MKVSQTEAANALLDQRYLEPLVRLESALLDRVHPEFGRHTHVSVFDVEKAITGVDFSAVASAVGSGLTPGGAKLLELGLWVQDHQSTTATDATFLSPQTAVVSSLRSIRGMDLNLPIDQTELSPTQLLDQCLEFDQVMQMRMRASRYPGSSFWQLRDGELHVPKVGKYKVETTVTAGEREQTKMQVTLKSNEQVPGRVAVTELGFMGTSNSSGRPLEKAEYWLTVNSAVIKLANGTQVALQMDEGRGHWGLKDPWDLNKVSGLPMARKRDKEMHWLATTEHSEGGPGEKTTRRIGVRMAENFPGYRVIQIFQDSAILTFWLQSVVNGLTMLPPDEEKRLGWQTSPARTQTRVQTIEKIGADLVKSLSPLV